MQVKVKVQLEYTKLLHLDKANKIYQTIEFILNN